MHLRTLAKGVIMSEVVLSYVALIESYLCGKYTLNKFVEMFFLSVQK